MRTTKTEDLIKFGPLEEITFHVTFYEEGTMLQVQIFHAKSKLHLDKKINIHIKARWPDKKDKISYKIR